MLAEAPPVAPEVVVHAARLPDPAGDAAFSTVAVDPERLREATDLDQALRSVPGFSLYRRTSTLGANPTTQGVSLRGIAGSGASRALVTLDGVPQNDPFGGWVIWTALPAQAIGDARIVRGAGAGPYGAGALTGVVQLDSPEATPGSGELEVSAGELGFRQGAAAGTFALGAARVFLDAAGQESGGWIPVRAGRGDADRPLDLHSWTAAGRVEHDIGRAVLTARLAGYEEDRGAGVVGASSRASGQQGSLTLAAQPGEGRLGWRLQGWVDGSDLYNSSASVSAERDLSTPANTQYATPALGWGLNAAVRSVSHTLSLEVGADVRGATGESRELFSYVGQAFTKTRKSGGETLVAGLYAEASRRLGRWLLTGGVRADGWADFDAERVERVIATGATSLNTRPADQSGVLPTGRLGVRRELGGGLAWRAAGYAGFRPATLNELHRPFRQGNNLTEADPALKPERLYGAETGLDYGRGGLTLSATLFHNRLEDAITNVTIGQGPGTFTLPGLPGVSDVVAAGGTLRMRENAGAVNATGLETEAVQRLLGDRLELRAAAAYTRSVVDGGDVAPQLDGLRPALTPRLTATAEAHWRATARFELTLDGRYESLRYDDDLNTLRLKPSLSFDLRADYALTPTLTAFVAADNLFDAAIQTAESADGVYSYDAPRLLRVGLRLRR